MCVYWPPALVRVSWAPSGSNVWPSVWGPSGAALCPGCTCSPDTLHAAPCTATGRRSPEKHTNTYIQCCVVINWNVGEWQQTVPAAPAHVAWRRTSATPCGRRWDPRTGCKAGCPGESGRPEHTGLKTHSMFDKCVRWMEKLARDISSPRKTKTYRRLLDNILPTTCSRLMNC